MKTKNKTILTLASRLTDNISHSFGWFWGNRRSAIFHLCLVPSERTEMEIEYSKNFAQHEHKVQQDKMKRKE